MLNMIPWKSLREHELQARNLFEIDPDTPRRWNGPIGRFWFEGKMACFERQWTEISYDEGKTWEPTVSVPARVNTDMTMPTKEPNGEIHIMMRENMGWVILMEGQTEPAYV